MDLRRCFFAALIVSAFASECVIDLSIGSLQGKLDKESGVCSYLGVPFAEPPVGDLRFRSPEPKAAWGNTRSAKSSGPACAQTRIAGPIFRGNEDCLYLNVYAPKTTENESLPVMFFIHGGGFIIGNAYKHGE